MKLDVNMKNATSGSWGVKYVTKQVTGILRGGTLISGAKWKELPPDLQKVVGDAIKANAAADTADTADLRKSDQSAYENLLKRGYTSNEWTGDAAEEYQHATGALHKALIGRMLGARPRYAAEVPRSSNVLDMKRSREIELRPLYL